MNRLGRCPLALCRGFKQLHVVTDMWSNPGSLDHMLSLGPSGKVTRCRGCGASITWNLTKHRA